MELLKELLKLDERKKKKVEETCEDCGMPTSECECEHKDYDDCKMCKEDLTEGKIKKPKKQRTGVYELPMKKGKLNNDPTVTKAVEKTKATTKDANSTGRYKQPLKKGSVNNGPAVATAVSKLTKVTKDGKSVGKYKSKVKPSQSASLNAATVKANKKKVS